MCIAMGQLMMSLGWLLKGKKWVRVLTFKCVPEGLHKSYDWIRHVKKIRRSRTEQWHGSFCTGANLTNCVQSVSKPVLKVLEWDIIYDQRDQLRQINQLRKSRDKTPLLSIFIQTLLKVCYPELDSRGSRHPYIPKSSWLDWYVQWPEHAGSPGADVWKHDLRILYWLPAFEPHLDSLSVTLHLSASIGDLPPSEAYTKRGKGWRKEKHPQSWRLQVY